MTYQQMEQQCSDTHMDTTPEVGGLMNTPQQSHIATTQKTISSSKRRTDVPIVLGNTMPSGHNASNVYSVDGIAPTIMDNHGWPGGCYILEESDDDIADEI